MIKYSGMSYLIVNFTILTLTKNNGGFETLLKKSCKNISIKSFLLLHLTNFILGKHLLHITN